jgi:hypothetical protein
MSTIEGPRRVQRLVTWGAFLLLVVGAIAFLTTRLGGDEDSTRPKAPPQEIAERLVQPDKKRLTAKDVPRAARVAAGQFIVAAAGREDLPKAWKLTHPSLRAQCACSYKEWLTGNIPVQFYPVDALDVTTFAVESVSPSRVMLLVALLPNEGSDVKPQSFYIGLKTAKVAGKSTWLVDYWAPYASIPVPAAVGG